MEPHILHFHRGDDPPMASLYYGQDVRTTLRTLPEKSVHMVATSPPFYGLRDYGLPPSEWADGWKGCLGLEPNPFMFVEHLVEVFQEVKRVLRDDGVLWLNLGDSYANDEKWGGSTGGKHVDMLHGTNVGRGKKQTGLPSKSLMGIPWRTAFAFQDDGWILRSDVIWEKGNPMPESVTDRPSKAHEYIFLFSKQPTYFYDSEAAKEPASEKKAWGVSCPDGGAKRASFQPHHGTLGTSADQNRNRRTVWHVNTKPYTGSHAAVWPPELVEPMIKAGSSEKGACKACGAPYSRIRDEGELVRVREGSNTSADTKLSAAQGKHGSSSMLATGMKRVRSTIGWEPTCDCESPEMSKCRVMDPFSGSATTGLVAMQLGRDYIGIDLNTEYLPLAKARLSEVAPPSTTEIDEPGLLDI